MSDWLANFVGDPHALLVLVIAGFLPNEVWRMAGLWFGAGVDEGSEILVWVRAVATAILLLTPLAFLLSTARNSKQLSDILALVLGLALYPVVAAFNTGVDILISGVAAGTIAYGAHWWRKRA